VPVIVEGNDELCAFGSLVDDPRGARVEIEAAVVLEDRAQRLAQLARPRQVRGAGLGRAKAVGVQLCRQRPGIGERLGAVLVVIGVDEAADELERFGG